MKKKLSLKLVNCKTKPQLFESLKMEFTSSRMHTVAGRPTSKLDDHSAAKSHPTTERERGSERVQQSTLAFAAPAGVDSHARDGSGDGGG